MFVFFFQQKTAYEMRISDWSSDVCSSDLPRLTARPVAVTSIAAGGSQFCVANEDGTLVLFDANQEILRKEQQKWEEMFGMHQHQGGIFIKPSAGQAKQQLQLTSKPKTKTSAPKHGKEDPKNTPHVGDRKSVE